MYKKVKIVSPVLLGLTLAITGCNTNIQDNQSELKKKKHKLRDYNL
ncbi:hypothetical protein [Peribacillus asahii]